MAKYTLEQHISSFWSKVNKNGSIPQHFPELGRCWEWTACCISNGYGTKKWINGYKYSHRISWELTFGEIPDGLWVLHKCDNPLCCNPKHLFLGTNQDNVNDRESKGRSKPSKGEKNGKSKLTDSQIIEIRALYSQGNISQKELGYRYGVTGSNIGYIVNKKSRV